MHKCTVCGTEFESKFCPNCGNPAPLKVCPNCGAKLSPTDKFCPKCGKPLRAPAAKPKPAPATAAASVHAPKPAPAAKRQNAPSPATIKFLAFLPYATAVLFALFSVLLFLMLLGSVSSVMGMSTGSIYQNTALSVGEEAGLFGEMMGSSGGNDIASLCIALVVFASFGIVLAICALAFRLSVPLRVKKIGNLRIYTLLNGCIFLFYIVDFLLACILCDTVSNEITSPGAGTICVLVFALLFGLCSAGTALVWHYRKNVCPSVAAELERQRAARRAVLTTPAKPEWKELVKPKKPRKPQYPVAECSATLKTKIIKYVKAKNLLMVFSAIVFLVFALVCTTLWLSFGGWEYCVPDTQEAWDLFSNLLVNVLLPLIVCSAGLTIILGGIFGSLYYKRRKPDFKWQRKRVWSDKAMFWTISAYCLALTFSCLMFSLFNVWAFKDHAELVQQMIVFICVFPFVITYYIVAYSCAGAIKHKGTKLSLAIFGAKRPWLNPELEEQYLADANAYSSRKQTYIEQKNAYLAERNAQRKVWRKYRRELAYFEEGIA